MIRVLIVDDNDLVRAGIRAALRDSPGILWVGECADGSQASDAVGATRPDVVLMDRQMPVMNGAAATRAVLAAHPRVKVLMISAGGDNAAVREAAAAGATGYLVKDGIPTAMIGAIRAVATGRPV